MIKRSNFMSSKLTFFMRSKLSFCKVDHEIKIIILQSWSWDQNYCMLLFRDNRDFLKKIWISHTFCPFWSKFWTTKCKQKGLGTKISIKIFVKIHYFSVEIEKKIEKSTKITYNHKNLDKSWQVSISLDLNQKVQSWLSSTRLNWDLSISIEKSQFSRLIFWNCRDFLDRQDWPFFGVKIESLDRDPQGSKEHKFSDVNALAVNVIIILLLDSSKVIQDEGTQVFGCKRSVLTDFSVSIETF
jgi:hypothetical protein